MARLVPWRRTCPEIVASRQREASESTIYILREMGPTGFLLKEEADQKVNKVLIGDVHSCTCPTFLKSNGSEPCRHICWILMKKFKVAPSEPVSWQLGLCEREVAALLKFSRRHTASERIDRKLTIDSGPDLRGTTVPQRVITEEDACPICQEDFSDGTQRITFCRFGCGNSMHIKCMMIWAAHRKPDSVVECPYCRADFGPVTLLAEEKMRSLVLDSKGMSQDFKAGRMEHRGTFCCSCGLTPIVGKCYKCDSCDSQDFFLCSKCFKTEIHAEHGFSYRLKTNQKWRRATNRQLLLKFRLIRLGGILAREIVEDDYETLLQLDEDLDNGGPSSTPAVNVIQEGCLNTLPSRRLGRRDEIRGPCDACSETLSEGQEIKRLPCCGRWLHRDCLEAWLLHWSPFCPSDGLELTEEVIAGTHKRKNKALAAVQSSVKPSKFKDRPGGGGDGPDMFVRGLNVYLPRGNLDLGVQQTRSAPRSVPKHPGNGNDPGSVSRVARRAEPIGRHPTHLPPLSGRDLPGVVSVHIAAVDLRTPGARRYRVHPHPPRSRSGLHAGGGPEGAPIAKKENSWPLIGNGRPPGKARLAPLRRGTLGKPERRGIDSTSPAPARTRSSQTTSTPLGRSDAKANGRIETVDRSVGAGQSGILSDDFYRDWADADLHGAGNDFAETCEH